MGLTGVSREARTSAATPSTLGAGSREARMSAVEEEEGAEVVVAVVVRGLHGEESREIRQEVLTSGRGLLRLRVSLSPPTAMKVALDLSGSCLLGDSSAD